MLAQREADETSVRSTILALKHEHTINDKPVRLDAAIWPREEEIPNLFFEM
jgi:hypothetical protein